MDKLSIELAEIYLYNISYNDKSYIIDNDLKISACFSNNLAVSLTGLIPIILNYVPEENLSNLLSLDKPVLRFILENGIIYPDIPFLKYIPENQRTSFIKHIKDVKELLQNEIIYICNNNLI